MLSFESSFNSNLMFDHAQYRTISWFKLDFTNMMLYMLPRYLKFLNDLALCISLDATKQNLDRKFLFIYFFTKNIENLELNFLSRIELPAFLMSMY